MSSAGEIYVSEACRDFAEKELNKVFGKGKWHISGRLFSDLWDEMQFPDEMEIPVENHDGETIGTLIIRNKFSVEDSGYGKYIEVSPEKVVKIHEEVK